MQGFISQLLETKLLRPSVPQGLVLRPRLFERLDRGVRGPITLVSAAAGYGKTTLISSWIESHLSENAPPAASMQVAWISLDEMDSDLHRFLLYLIAGLRTIFAGACAGTLDVLQARQDAPLEQLVATFSNEVQQLSPDFIVVLDDHQSVDDEEISDFLSHLTRHWPAPLHLVLISRRDPMLMPLASLRANGLLAEIRTRDLKFTREETALYLNQALPQPIDESASERLDRHVEGWIAGIQLAAISLSSADDAGAALDSLSGTEADFADYLVNEVLAHQPEQIRVFLLETAFLDHFCASLCDAVISDDDLNWPARTCIDWLVQGNLFIVPLDNRREWYRYHHIFRSVLQARALAELGPQRVDDLQCSAAGWFDERGMTDEALRHVVATQDLDMAARLMEHGLRDVLNREDRPTLERWLHLLPDDMIEARPGLLIMKAWSLHLSWQHDALNRLLQRLDLLFGEPGEAVWTAEELQIVRGQMLELLGQQSYYANHFARALACCQEALGLLPESWSYARSGTKLYLGLALQASGQAQAAEQLFVDDYRSLSNKTGTYGLRLLLGLCLVGYNEAVDLERVRQTAQRLAEGAELSGLGIMRGWGQYFLGIVHYQRNELPAAREHFDKLLQYRYTANAGALRDGAQRLARIHLSMGNLSEAWRVADLLGQIDLDYEGRESELTASLRAWLRLGEGDLEGATRWADAFREPVPDRAQLYAQSPHLSKAQILIERGRNEDLRTALEILGSFYSIAERGHNTRLKIEVLAMRAMALRAQGRNNEWQEALQTAVNLAWPGGSVRPFVEAGPGMREALEELCRQTGERGDERDLSAETLRRIMGPFPPDADNPALSTSQTPRGPLVVTALPEPLTGREVEVLTLLNGPLSLKEIARDLNVSPSTVKSHTLNIYGKLGVNRRRDAVTRAQVLGILASH